MFKDILGEEIYSSNYRDDLFTYEIQKDISTVPILLDTRVKHKPFKFLDENVLIHESVTVFLKSEKELLNEGWEPKGKSSLALKNSKAFLIGKEKKKLLGKQVSGLIGITRDLQPFFFDAANHWRFGEKEIKLILKSNDLNIESKHIIINGEDYNYDASANRLYLPNGQQFSGQLLNNIRLALKALNLI